MAANKLFSNKQIAHYFDQILRGDPDPTGMRKEVENKDESLKLQVIWDFEVKCGKSTLAL